MTQEPLMRIGAPPQPAKRKPRLLLVVVLAFGLAVGVITLSLVIPRLIDAHTGAEPMANLSPSDSKPTEIQIQCAAIRHEYTVWKTSDANLRRIQSIKARDVFDFEMSRLIEAGQAFLKASSGYADQPSKKLAVAIAEHNLDAGLLKLEGTLSGTLKPETYEKVKSSRAAVETAYESFLVLTCA